MFRVEMDRGEHLDVGDQDSGEASVGDPDFLVMTDDGGIDLGATLRAYREEFDVTSKDLAEIIGVNVGTIRAWGYGKVSPSVRQVTRAAFRLGLSIPDSQIDRGELEREIQARVIAGDALTSAEMERYGGLLGYGQVVDGKRKRR